MKKKISAIGILITFLVLGGLFLGCPNETEQSKNTIKVTVQNNSGYKLYSVKAGGVEIGDIEIGTTQRKDIEPDGLSYSVFFTIKLTSTNVNIKTTESKAYNSDVTVIIDNTTMVTLTTGEQSVKALSQLISDIQNSGNNNNGNGGDDNLTLGTLPDGTLAEKINYIATKTDHNVLYDIAIDANIVFGSLDDPVLETKGSNIVIHIHSADPNDIKTISVPNINPGAIFGVDANVTLKLSNIILKGSSNNGNPVLFSWKDGTIIIEDGTVITGNINVSDNGSGIIIDRGTLIMNGGEINGNSAIHSSKGVGAGVLLMNGNFTMNGGKINNNTACYGGGIYIHETGSFTMNGGIISGNFASINGGGIYSVDQTLTQNGGGRRIIVTINGGEIINNTGEWGGGITLYNSRLVKTGGFIAGIDDENANRSNINTGHAVLYCRDYTFWDRKISLNQNENLSTDNLNSGWTFLGDIGSF